MEYLLRELKAGDSVTLKNVLILIVMEYLLREILLHYLKNLFKSLNPYCYGIPSQSGQESLQKIANNKKS